MRDFKKMLLISFEIVVYGGGLLLLPCAMAGLLSDSLVSDLVAAVVVVAAVGTAILTAIAIHEGWFLKAPVGLAHQREKHGARCSRASRPNGRRQRNQGDT